LLELGVEDDLIVDDGDDPVDHVRRARDRSRGHTRDETHCDDRNAQFHAFTSAAPMTSAAEVRYPARPSGCPAAPASPAACPARPDEIAPARAAAAPAPDTAPDPRPRSAPWPACPRRSSRSPCRAAP